MLQGHDVTGQSPSRISRLGVARTFQRNNLFQNLSVAENLRLALAVRFGNPLDFFSVAARDETLVARIRRLLRQVHLDERERADRTHPVLRRDRQLEVASAGE